MNTKIIRRCMVLTVLMIVTFSMMCTESFAYFQRGSVGVYAGRGSVSVAQGGSTAVSLSFSPASSSQLPGCGMAECPQACGEGCLDANGECTCAGTAYTTYYTSASAYSSNTSVATASCSGNTVYIRGVSPGSATITVTASLRQYTSTSTSIAVTVTAAAKPSASTPASSGSSGEVSAKAVDKDRRDNTASNKSQVKDRSNDTRETDEKETETTSTVDSERGKITFVQIPDGKAGKDELADIAGKDEYVDFQKKDEAGTILYSWEFLGKDIDEARDVDLNLEFSREAFEGCVYDFEKEPVYIKRGDPEALPGKASTYIRTTDWFDGSEKLYLYSFDEEDGLSLLESGLKQENGYVTCTTMYGDADKYVLSDEKLDVEKADAADDADNTNIAAWLTAGIAAAIAAVAAAIVLIRRRRRGSGEK